MREYLYLLLSSRGISGLGGRLRIAIVVLHIVVVALRSPVFPIFGLPIFCHGSTQRFRILHRFDHITCRGSRVEAIIQLGGTHKYI